MEYGPVQVIVVALPDDAPAAAVLAELGELRARGAVRLIDVTILSKDDDGRLSAVEPGGLGGDWSAFGEIAGALSGCRSHSEEGLSVGAAAGAAAGFATTAHREAWAISDAIPPGTRAAVVLFEHCWAVPLRRAIGKVGGFALEDTWVHVADLIAVGAVGSRDMGRPD